MTVLTEDLIEKLGNPGKVQVIVFIVLAFSFCPITINTIIMAVYGAKVPFHCNDVQHAANGSYVPDGPGQLQDTCTAWGPAANQTGSCTSGWSYNTTEISMVTEFNLVCEREYLLALSTSVFFGGSIIGGFVVDFFSDSFGRRPVIVFTFYSQFIVGIGQFFVNNYTVYLVTRFVHGIFIQGLLSAIYVMVMELFRPAHRSYVGPIMEAFWGTSYITLAGIWYLLKDWRYIQLAINLPFVPTLIYICFMPESLRWLLSKNKFDEAERLIRRTVKYNKIPYPESAMAEIKSQMTSDILTKTTKYTVLDLFKTPTIRRRSLILFFTWFSAYLAYIGLSLGATKLNGNKFLNFFLSGIVEFPAYIASLFILKRFGRRVPQCVYFILCGLTCIGAGFIYSGDPTRQKISLAMVMFGKLTAAGLFTVVMVFAVELYPTVIRNIGCGACGISMKCAGLVAPHILRMQTLTFRQLPILVFGGFALLAGALTLLLPETLNKQLPDKIEDVEDPKLPKDDRESIALTNQLSRVDI